MPTRHLGSLAKNSSTRLRDNFCRKATCPAASTPCTRKTDFAISNPIVVTCFIVVLLSTHPQIMLREGRESRPHHQNQTVTRGGGSETLQVGTGSDPLSYHAVETIDASTSSGEQFNFSAGFGKETINGFSVSGTTPDSIQLGKASFSYLTQGMTQAEDLAAVMSQATKSWSGLTINDTHGDSLTLTGATPSLVAANPGMFAFT